MKIVINSDWGGFSLSDKAVRKYFELKGWKCIEEVYKLGIILFYKDEKIEDNIFNFYELDRSDPDLVKVVEELGEEANGPYSKLKVIEVPEGVKWHIDEYDGIEHVAEDHRVWS